MTELIKDIYNQPDELGKSLAYTLGPGRAALERGARIFNDARHLYITGIGSSWHAGMAILSLFNEGCRPAFLLDAAELLHFAEIPPDSAIMMLSRSGKSVEIVNLLKKAKQAGAKVVGITNTPDSPLGQQSDVTLRMEAAFDHNVSITMYSALNLVGGLLACEAMEMLDKPLTDALARSLRASRETLDGWRGQIESSDWFENDAPAYLLARGGSLSSCHETQLLWEEAAKSPASAMSTGGFRHGPQEIVREGLRFILWIDPERQRSQDLTLADDLRRYGAKVMLIGQNLPPGSGNPVLNLPETPARWQFLIDSFPAQLAAEHLSRLRGVDCDSFAICPYIIESEGGLRG